jgi:uncharacterized protein (DUF488 family)
MSNSTETEPGRAVVVFTIGHSTRTVEDFAESLKAHGVRTLIDVRTVPGSARNPQFNSEALEQSLRSVGIAYVHRKGLGGLRRPSKDSRNGGWRNASFRGFADYMQTDEFEENLSALQRDAGDTVVAIMCAEAVPWRCHRSLIADALSARGVVVRHIISGAKTSVHALTPFARVEGTRVTYPATPTGEAPDDGIS